MKRRKILLVLLLFCLLLGVGGCAKKQEIIYLSEEEFLSYGAEVELSWSNWEEFFELQPGMVMESYNSGGTYLYQYMYLVPKEFCVVSSETAELLVLGTGTGTQELYDIYTGEQVLVTKIEWEFAEELSIGDDKTARPLCLIYEEDKSEIWYRPLNSEGVIKCTSILKDGEVEEIYCSEAGGVVSSFLIPEEVWNVDDDGVRYLCIGKTEDFFRIYEPSFYEDTRRYLKKTDKLGGGV